MKTRLAELTEDVRQATRSVTASRLAAMAKGRAKSKWGSALQFMGRDLRSAVVAYEYVAIIAGQEAIEPGSQAERLIQGAQEIVKA